MKINFERTGGFAGIRLAIDLDLDTLSPGDAADLKKLVVDADLFNSSLPDAGRIRDGFQYIITVEDENQRKTIQLSDGSIPEKLALLVNDLVLRARAKR